jgi:hypothetical protein
MVERISEIWCKTMHKKAMWPIHGRYICPQCMRQYRVGWEGIPQPEEYADPELRIRPVPVQDPVEAIH